MKLFVGQKASRSITLTREHVKTYAELSGDGMKMQVLKYDVRVWKVPEVSHKIAHRNHPIDLYPYIGVY